MAGLKKTKSSIVQLLIHRQRQEMAKTSPRRLVSLLHKTRQPQKKISPASVVSPVCHTQAYHYQPYPQPPRSQSAACTNVKSVSLDTSRNSCMVIWEDNLQSQFHSTWLRHNCHCAECRHPNGQKLLHPTNVSCSLKIANMFIQGNVFKISWSGKDKSHHGEIPLSFLRDHNYNKETILQRRLAVKCNAITEMPTVNYRDITSSQDSQLEWLQQINEAGISLVKGVPTEDNMVHKVAQIIGPVVTTIYGTTFDVEVTPDPINVAYSSLGIDLHQDLAYFESPPGLQLLHCVEFDDCVDGGENIFLDVFDVVDKFRANFPDQFDTLTKVPATFQKVHYDRDLPVHIVNQKPHIKLNHLGEVIAVYWSPPFEGPLSVGEEDVEKYYLAYETFAKFIETFDKMRYRLKPGELVIFNNLRMLHGRTTFQTNGGARKLQGCYVNIDIYKSRTQVMNNLVGDGSLAKRVGNQCYF